MGSLGIKFSPTTGINGYEKYSINVMKLDSFIKGHNIDIIVDDRAFLKIDLQGFEKKVLDGAIESLRFFELIQVEMSMKVVYFSRKCSIF